MNRAIAKFLEYLRSVRNASPHTISNYGKDLDQFQAYMTPPGAAAPAVAKVNHQIIREFIGHLHQNGLEKSSIARKLAALRSFFKYCLREGMLKDNPARLVPTPRLPKRIPAVLSAEMTRWCVFWVRSGYRIARRPKGWSRARKNYIGIRSFS